MANFSITRRLNGDLLIAMDDDAPASLADLRILVPNRRWILGGSSVQADEHPWSVFLMRRHSTGSTYLCSGVLIDPSWLLTAAHCLAQSGDRAIVNRRDLDLNPSHPGGAVVDVLEVRTCDYPQNQENDLALVKLARPIKPAEGRPIAIDTKALNSGDRATVIGLGETTARLSEVEIPVSSANPCISLPHFNPKLQLCAGELGKGPCDGDSGSPLIVDRSGAFELAGVVSRGPTPDQCSGGSSPHVSYTRPSAFVDWIDSVLMGQAPPARCRA